MQVCPLSFLSMSKYFALELEAFHCGHSFIRKKSFFGLIKLCALNYEERMSYTHACTHTHLQQEAIFILVIIFKNYESEIEKEKERENENEK